MASVHAGELTRSLTPRSPPPACVSLSRLQFGGLLAGIELGLKPIAPWVRSNLQYLMTTSGRTAMLAFLGGLTWPLGRLGLVPALLTCFNAVFNANFAQLLAFVSADDAATAAAAGSRRAVGGGAAGKAAAAEEAAVNAGAAAALAAAEEAARAQAGAGGGSEGGGESEGEGGEAELAAMREALEAARAQAS